MTPVQDRPYINEGGTSQSSYADTWGTNPTLGNKITYKVIVDAYPGAAGIVNVTATDNAVVPNTYNVAGIASNSGNLQTLTQLSADITSLPASGQLVVTLSYKRAGSAIACYSMITATEWHGLVAGAPDQSATLSSNAVSGTSISVGPTGTLAQAAELVEMCFTCDTGTTSTGLSIPSGTTVLGGGLQQDDSNYIAWGACYETVASTAAITLAYGASTNVSGTWDSGSIVTYKIAPTQVPYTPPQMPPAPRPGMFVGLMQAAARVVANPAPVAAVPRTTILQPPPPPASLSAALLQRPAVVPALGPVLGPPAGPFLAPLMPVPTPPFPVALQHPVAKVTANAPGPQAGPFVPPLMPPPTPPWALALLAQPVARVTAPAAAPPAQVPYTPPILPAPSPRFTAVVVPVFVPGPQQTQPAPPFIPLPNPVPTPPWPFALLGSPQVFVPGPQGTQPAPPYAAPLQPGSGVPWPHALMALRPMAPQVIAAVVGQPWVPPLMPAPPAPSWPAALLSRVLARTANPPAPSPPQPRPPIPMPVPLPAWPATLYAQLGLVKIAPLVPPGGYWPPNSYLAALFAAIQMATPAFYVNTRPAPRQGPAIFYGSGSFTVPANTAFFVSATAGGGSPFGRAGEQALQNQLNVKAGDHLSVIMDAGGDVFVYGNSGNLLLSLYAGGGNLSAAWVATLAQNSGIAGFGSGVDSGPAYPPLLVFYWTTT